MYHDAFFSRFGLQYMRDNTIENMHGEHQSILTILG